MKWNWSYLLWVFLVVWFIASILKSFNFELWWQVNKKKRKFFLLKATASLWENDGRWEFWMPKHFVEKSKNYLESHQIEFEQIVEELSNDNNWKIPTRWFKAITDLSNTDHTFGDRSRRMFYTFHVDPERIKELKPLVLRFSLRNLRTGWYLSEK